jgi:hypothetical protein
MATQWTTLTATVGPISAGGTGLFSLAAGASRLFIGKVKIVPLAGSGTLDAGIYKHATGLAADVVLAWAGAPTSPGIIDPIESAGGGPTERNQGHPIMYEDLDASDNINYSITNHDAASRSFSVSMDVMIPDLARPIKEAVAMSGTSGSLSTTPATNAMVSLYKNGVLLHQGMGADYTISGTTITLAVAEAGEYFFADYVPK